MYMTVTMVSVQHSSAYLCRCKHSCCMESSASMVWKSGCLKVIAGDASISRGESGVEWREREGE